MHHGTTFTVGIKIILSIPTKGCQSHMEMIDEVTFFAGFRDTDLNGHFLLWICWEPNSSFRCPFAADSQTAWKKHPCFFFRNWRTCITLTPKLAKCISISYIDIQSIDNPFNLFNIDSLRSILAGEASILRHYAVMMIILIIIIILITGYHQSHFREHEATLDNYCHM